MLRPRSRSGTCKSPAFLGGIVSVSVKLPTFVGELKKLISMNDLIKFQEALNNKVKGLKCPVCGCSDGNFRTKNIQNPQVFGLVCPQCGHVILFDIDVLLDK